MAKGVLFVLILAMFFALPAYAETYTAEDIIPTYAFGEVPRNVTPGESVTIPLYITVNNPVSSVILQIKFDNTAFEYIPYNSSTDKGDAGFGVIQAAVTDTDDSLVGFFGMNLSATKEVQPVNTLLVNFRFTVKDSAEFGEKTFEIVKSTTAKSVDTTEVGGISCEDYVASPVSFKVSDIIKGDTNGDGKITVIDAVVILRHVSGIETMADSKLLMADVDGIEGVGTTDAVAVLKYSARLISEF